MAAVVAALGWALVHFVWQGAAIGLIFFAGNLALRRASANARYMFACLALLTLFLAPVFTYVTHLERPRVAVRMSAASHVTPAPPVAPRGTVPARSGTAGDLLPALVALWFAGVIALSAWHAGGWIVSERLKRRSRDAAPADLLDTLERLAHRLAVSRPVRLSVTAFAQTPMVIGWLRPVILFPVSALAGLDPRQVEALLAHELAHIRRHDYLVNLLQTAVETLLFYHPAVWWISRRIRIEREHCCDDLAVAACGDALHYARALTDLEQLRIDGPIFAVGAAGGSLSGRVRRLIGAGETGSRRSGWWVAIPLLAVIAAAAGPARQARAAKPPRPALASFWARAESPDSPRGFLAGLADAGYTSISVDDIIALKENGVTPRFVKGMKTAGLGTPSPRQLIQLHQHGVEPEYAAEMQRASIRDLTFERLITLKDNGVNSAAMREIHDLGFGPYSTGEAIRLQQHGVGPDDFRGFKEAGFRDVSAEDAVTAHSNGVTSAVMRGVRRQGFDRLTLQQIIKLKRAGVIE